MKIEDFRREYLMPRTFEDDCIALQRDAMRAYLYDALFHVRVQQALRSFTELTGRSVTPDERALAIITTYLGQVCE